jgi:glycosyltransferase 2 family protein
LFFMTSQLSQILATSISASRRKAFVSLLAGLLLSGTFLVLASRGANWRNIFETVSNADLRFVAAGMALFSTGSFVRSLRWRELLKAEKTIAVEPVFWATMAGYAGNTLLPLRAGEVIRALLIAAVGRISRTFCFASALLERLIDTLILVTVLLALFGSLPAMQEGVRARLWLFMAALLLGFAGAWIILRWWKRSLKTRSHCTFVQRLFAEILDKFGSGLSSVFETRTAMITFALSVIAWSIDAVGAAVIASSLDMDLSPHRAMFLLASFGLASALPSAPGYVGTWQLVAVTVLPPFGFTQTQSLAYVIVLQFAVVTCALGWGIPGFFRLTSAAGSAPVGSATDGDYMSQAMSAGTTDFGRRG